MDIGTTPPKKFVGDLGILIISLLESSELAKNFKYAPSS
jgi:hypothetical protein